MRNTSAISTPVNMRTKISIGILHAKPEYEMAILCMDATINPINL